MTELAEQAFAEFLNTPVAKRWVERCEGVRAGMMTIKPLAGRIQIQRIDDEDVSKGGVIIPDMAKKRPDQGIVIAKGAGVTDDIAVGDKILYEKFDGVLVKLDGKEYLMVGEDAILAVVE